MKTLICPICGTPAPFTPIYLSLSDVHRHTDGVAASSSKVVAAVMSWSLKDIRYAIIECVTCKDCFVAAQPLEKEWFVAYPIPSRLAAAEIPEPIKGEFEEASLCFAVGAYRACASMCQIALEAVWRDKQVSSLAELESEGFISSALRKQGDEIRLWGNVAKHEKIPDAVSKDDAEQLLAYLEAILEHLYVEPVRLERLTGKRQQIEGKSSQG